MSLPEDIVAYHAQLAAEARSLCEHLAESIARALPDATGRVWHGHPVWFLEQNPIVGYSHRKSGVRLLFWSGQSFPTPGLRPDGKFKAAGVDYAHLGEVDAATLDAWLSEGRAIQWDYANLVKRRGVLERVG